MNIRHGAKLIKVGSEGIRAKNHQLIEKNRPTISVSRGLITGSNQEVEVMKLAKTCLKNVKSMS